MTPERLQSTTERDARLRLYAELGDSRQYLGPHNDEIGARELMRADVASLLKERDALASDYAAAIMVLRMTEWASETEGCEEACAVCYESHAHGHSDECVLGAVLSTPPAKEVE